MGPPGSGFLLPAISQQLSNFRRSPLAASYSQHLCPRQCVHTMYLPGLGVQPDQRGKAPVQCGGEPLPRARHIPHRGHLVSKQWMGLQAARSSSSCSRHCRQQH